jgi:integrase
MFLKSGPRTLGEFVESYSLFHDVQAESMRQVRISVKLFERWAGGPVPLDQLDAASVSAWLRDYAAAGAAPNTVRSKRNQVLAMWRAAADEGLCDLPTRRVRPVRVPYKPPDCWTVDEVQQLLDACRKLKRTHKCGLRRSEWFQLAVLMAWDTGIRVGDLFRLRVSDISPEGLVALSQHKTAWGHTAQLSPTTLRVLRASLEKCPRDLVCPWPASRETFEDQVTRLVALAGIRPGTWKWLRRASATDVERLAEGHGSRHLGHKPGSRVAIVSYLNPRICGRPVVPPTELRVDKLPGETDRESDRPAAGMSEFQGEN